MTYHDVYLAEVFRRLAGPDGADIIAKAVALTHKRDASPGTDPRYGRRWRELLQGPPQTMAAVVLADTDEGRRLRHAMPFANVLSNKDKSALRRLYGNPRAHSAV